VVGIVEGKLGGGGSTRNRAGVARFRGRRWCFGDWSAERRRKIGQGALAWRCGADGALGGRRVGTLVRLEFRIAAENEIIGAMFWAARVREEEEERVR
jgi:hypothetical protein